MSTTSNRPADPPTLEAPGPAGGPAFARYAVLDELRFVAAFCVALHHTIGVPYRLAPGGATWVPELLGSIWFGSAAVVVFFVISGFCVHGPYEAGKPFDLGEFVIRRYVRLLVPLVVTLGIGQLVGVDYHPRTGMVTWSLVCELVYYSAYPLLRGVFARGGWALAILVPGLLGYAITTARIDWPPDALVGLVPAILIYAPGWIAGCWLASRKGRLAVPGPRWAWRSLAFAFSFGAGLLHYRHVVDLSYSLPLFPLVVTPWLAKELATPGRSGWLARAGEWSYSLYLLHPAAFHVAMLGFATLGLGTVTGRLPAIAATLLACWLFFRVVEWPSHQLARTLARRWLDRGKTRRDAVA